MTKKSPIKAKTLRHYGQSIDEKIDDLIYDKAVPYFMVTLLFTIMAGREWWVYFKELPPSPRLLTVIAVCALAITTFKVLKIRKEIKFLKQGREGERAVGQFLELFREKGCKVFHDVVGEGFNLDHVIVSEKGVYLIETKTFSKPEGKKPTILFDGLCLIIDGYNDKDKILNQARAASNWLKQLIHSTTGKKTFVRPVVLFPGWFIEPSEKGKRSDVWILNPKALSSYIDNQQTTISREDVSLTAYHLSRYVRSSEAERLSKI